MTIKLTIEDLKTINKKPLETELSLQVISNFYQECLMNRVFEFYLDYPNQPVIKLRFEEDNLCHLLGFQHIFEDEPNAKSFTGFSGFDFICTEVVTMETFKQRHIKAKYKENRERILYFPSLASHNFKRNILISATWILEKKRKLRN